MALDEDQARYGVKPEWDEWIAQSRPRPILRYVLLCTIRGDQRQKTRLPIWERIWERNQYLNALYVPLRSQNAC
jgi:hypothetical protein